MYRANGLNFEDKEDYVRGTADIEWEEYRNSVSDGCIEKMPAKEVFVKAVYDSIMSGVSNGVWSKIDMDSTCGSADVPDEIRFLGEERIKGIIGEFWEDQEDKPAKEEKRGFDMEVGPDGRYKVGGDTHIKVYQIDREKTEDEEYRNRMFYRGMGWDLAEKRGTAPKDLSDYKLMWEGDLDVHGEPEGAYIVLQDRRPIETSQTMYSLSVGDIIAMDGRYHFVDGFGFKDITDILEVA